MSNNSNIQLPGEFMDGPWISAAELADWLGDSITAPVLQSLCARDACLC